MMDLHCHTSMSDGSLSPEKVIRIACEKGVTVLGITDHDTTEQLVNICSIGSKYEVNIVPGIEISAFDHKQGKRAHILGFHIKHGFRELDGLCGLMLERRQSASKLMVEKVVEAGFKITWQDVEKYAKDSKVVYKQHIMHALLDKKYCSSIYCSLYKQLFSRIGENGKSGIAYVPVEYIDAVSAIKAVRYAGGIPILAHPGQFGNYDSISEWVSEGLVGIEAYHPCHSNEDIDLSLKIASEYKLAVTGGSDFHGFYGEAEVELGCSRLDEKCVHL